jgi:Flp pilus assembly protein TadD
MNVHLAWHYLAARQNDSAISQSRKTLEMSPNYIRAHHFMGVAYLQKSMYAEGIQELQKAVALKGDGMEAVGDLGYAYAISGRKKDAFRILRELQEASHHGYVSPYDRAVIYAGLGDKEQAFYWLNRAYEERNSKLAFLKAYAQFDKLRSDPRFSHLMKRVGLTE